MISNNRKLYLVLSAIILAITLYQISLLKFPQETSNPDSQDFNEYKINTQPLTKEKQGNIDSH